MEVAGPLALGRAEPAASELAAGPATPVAQICITSEELVVQGQARRRAGEEVLDLGEPSSFMEEAFSSLKTA